MQSDQIEYQSPRFRADADQLQQEQIEIERHNLATLNREAARLQHEGWSVQSLGNQLICTREAGHSAVTAIVFTTVVTIAIALAALEVLSQLGQAKFADSRFLVVGAAAGLGLALGFLRERGAASGRVERISITLDRNGRPMVNDMPSRDL